jgi:hypothetical protein
MGLDMYASSVPAEVIGNQQVDIVFPAFIRNEYLPQQFAQWCKFNHLHGWMQRLYFAKGGVSPDFNCDTVRITATEINLLEAAWKNKALTATEGFFFGGDEWEPEYDDELLTFIAKARACFARGEAVLYSSWW